MRIGFALFTMTLLHSFPIGAQKTADLSSVWQMDASRNEPTHRAAPIGHVKLAVTMDFAQRTITGGNATPVKTTARSEVSAGHPCDQRTGLTTEAARNGEGHGAISMSIFGRNFFVRYIQRDARLRCMDRPKAYPTLPGKSVRERET